MNNTEEQAIHKDMPIEEIFTRFPHKSQRLAQEMTNKGLHCVGCQASTWETLEAGMLGHGMSLNDVEELLKTLNGILMEETDRSSITVTTRAADKYRQILLEENKADWGLRFEEKAGGCGGFEYLLDYSQRAKADDIVITSNGLELHVAKNMLERLLGSEIDYVDGLKGAGFKISNPNVTASCHCGNSHNY